MEAINKIGDVDKKVKKKKTTNGKVNFHIANSKRQFLLYILLN